MTRDEFEAGYAERSNMTVAALYDYGVFPALPCDCGEELCLGWRRRYLDDHPAWREPAPNVHTVTTWPQRVEEP